MPGQRTFWVPHLVTIPDLKSRIRTAFQIMGAITFTLPPNGPVFNRHGLIGDRVLPGSDVPCAYLTRNTHLGVHFPSPSSSQREPKPHTVPSHNVDGQQLSLAERLRREQQLTPMRRSAVPVVTTDSTPLQPALTSLPSMTVPQSGQSARTMIVPPDDFRKPSRRTQCPPLVPLDYRLVATPVALIPNDEDYQDTDQNTSSSAPAPNNPTTNANTKIKRVPSHQHLVTEHAALTREHNRWVAKHTALRHGFPDVKRQKQNSLSSPDTSPTGTLHDNKPRLTTPVMSIPQTPAGTHCGQPTLAHGPRDQFPQSATNREHLTQINSLDGSPMPATIPTSMGTTNPHRQPEWEPMPIGILPPQAEGYSTPTHLRPIQEAIRAVLFRPGSYPSTRSIPIVP
jgi:hypothetical protein